MELQSITSQGPQTIYELVSFVSQIVQTFVIIIGVPLVIRQIQQQTEATRLQNESLQFTNYLQVMTEASSINMMAITDSELLEFYDEDKLPPNLGNSWETLNIVLPFRLNFSDYSKFGPFYW